MKRFHVHVGVDDIQQGIAFYTKLFGAPPTVSKPDYAKWMVEDPRINFAISSRGGKAGLNHLGIQVDSSEEFEAMHAQLAAADAGLVEELDASCCYARSDKYWVTDPSGIAWETYHTLGTVPMFAGDSKGACCTPETTAAQATCCVTESPNAKVVVRACCA